MKHTPGTVDIHAADDDNPPGNSRGRLHQLLRLLAGAGNQVDDDIRRETFEVSAVAGKIVAITLNLCEAGVRSGEFGASVKDCDFVSPRK